MANQSVINFGCLYSGMPDFVTSQLFTNAMCLGGTQTSDVMWRHFSLGNRKFRDLLFYSTQENHPDYADMDAEDLAALQKKYMYYKALVRICIFIY